LPTNYSKARRCGGSAFLIPIILPMRGACLGPIEGIGEIPVGLIPGC